MKQVIVISGGSDGLGKAIARTLSPKNQVIILAPNREKLARIAQELNCDFASCDVSDYDQCQKAIDDVLKKYKRIDCLVNNAAIWLEGVLEDHNPADIKRMLEVNLLGTLYLTKAVIPTVKKAKQGTIINIVSQAGLYAKKERSVYNTTKWGLTGFTKCLQLDLAPHNIKVTGLYPGKLNTKLFEKVGIKKEMSDAMDTGDVAKVIEFILSFDNDTFFPEVGLNSISRL